MNCRVKLRETFTSQILLKASSTEPKTRTTAQKSMTIPTKATTPPCAAAKRLVGEGDEVVDHLAVVRKERIEVLHQSVGQPEPLDHGEDERRDRNDRP